MEHLPCAMNFAKHLNYFLSLPWLVWLCGLSAGLRTKGSLIQFPVRAHAWIAGQVPSGGPHDRQPHIDVSPPLFLPPFPSL